MWNKKTSELASYFGVGALAILFAFAISTRFMGRSFSQETPPVDGANPQGAVPAEGATPNSQGADDVSALQGFLEPFIYDQNNRRDPFQPYVEYREEKGIPAATAKFEVDDYQLVGIMWDTREPRAMFIDPERKVHIIGRDESIGKRNGYVAAIREGEVVVVESQRKQGDIVYKTKVIKISR